MDIFYLMPRTKTKIIFLFERDDIVYEGTCDIDISNPNRVEISVFPIGFDAIDIPPMTEQDVHDISTNFLNFLFSNKRKTKIGSLLKDCPNLYKYVLKTPTFIMEDNELNMYFNIYNAAYKVESVRVIKNKDDIQLLLKRDSFLHDNNVCGCQKIKDNNGIVIDSCLFCVEHESFIYQWLVDEYKTHLKQVKSKYKSNIIPFPTKYKK